MYRDRTIATLRFTNSTEMALNLTIFDFQPRWGIKKLFPAKMEYDTVDPGDCITCKVELYQPENWDPKSPDHVDYLKAFITVRPMPFSCLELPPLNTIYTASRNGLMNDSSDLEKLLNILGVGNRHARLVGAGRGDWMTAEIEIWTISDEANAEDEAGYILYIYAVR